MVSLQMKCGAFTCNNQIMLGENEDIKNIDTIEIIVNGVKLYAYHTPWCDGETVKDATISLQITS